MSNAEPMTTARRGAIYGPRPTPRQRRQLRRMLNREVSRGLGQITWTRPPARKAV